MNSKELNPFTTGDLKIGSTIMKTNYNNGPRISKTVLPPDGKLSPLEISIHLHKQIKST